eukprot:gene5516-988_t
MRPPPSKARIAIYSPRIIIKMSTLRDRASTSPATGKGGGPEPPLRSVALVDWQAARESFEAFFSPYGEVTTDEAALRFRSVPPHVPTSFGVARGGSLITASMPLHDIQADFTHLEFDQAARHVMCRRGGVAYTYRVPPQLWGGGSSKPRALVRHAAFIAVQTAITFEMTMPPAALPDQPLDSDRLGRFPVLQWIWALPFVARVSLFAADVGAGPVADPGVAQDCRQGLGVRNAVSSCAKLVDASSSVDGCSFTCLALSCCSTHAHFPISSTNTVELGKSFTYQITAPSALVAYPVLRECQPLRLAPHPQFGLCHPGYTGMLLQIYGLGMLFLVSSRHKIAVMLGLLFFVAAMLNSRVVDEEELLFGVYTCGPTAVAHASTALPELCYPKCYDCGPASVLCQHGIIYNPYSTMPAMA